jgi:hypothetical protein
VTYTASDDAVRGASTRRDVFDLLDDSPVPMKPAQIAERLKRQPKAPKVAAAA